MKKFLFISIASAISFAACQKSEVPMVPCVPETDDSQEVVTPTEQVEKTFVAQCESKLKTALNNTSVMWQSGDQIKIFWDNGSVVAEAKTYNYNAYAEFKATVEEADAYYAAYPTSAGYEYASDKISVNVPSVQTGSFADVCLICAKADGENNLRFKHLVGYLEFTIDKCGTLTFSCGPDIAGNVTATFGEDGELSSCTQTGSSDVITIEIPCSGTYYIALLPEVEMDFLSFTLTSGSTTEYILSTKPNEMTRGKLLGLGNITDRFSPDRKLGATIEDFTIIDFDFWF